MSSIALFGGAFNPVHNGHVELVKNLIKLNLFSEVILIPTGIPPHKAAIETSPHHRLEMLKLAFNNIKQVRIDSIELDQSPETPSYSINTIQSLTKKNPNSDLTFVMGLDAFNIFLKWFQYEEILNLVNLLIVKRKESPILEAELVLKKLSELKMITQIESNAPQFMSNWSIVRSKKLIQLIDLDLPNISSSQIREDLKMGSSIDLKVPDLVSQYLKLNRPYAN